MDAAVRTLVIVCVAVTVICWPLLVRYMVQETRRYRQLYGKRKR